MGTLNKENLDRFLTTEPSLLKLAMTTPSGELHVVPIWYDYDGSDFFVMGSAATKWVGFLRTSPSVACCVDRAHPPYVQVLFKGTAEVVEEEHYWDDPKRSIRYFGEEEGLAYFKAQKDRPRVLIRIRPRNMTTWTADPELSQED